MAKEQRVFPEEFKREAVHLVQTSGRPMLHSARDLGISDRTLHHWCKQAAEQRDHPIAADDHQSRLDEENRRLQRENELLKQERDILKKRPCHSVTPMIMKISYTILQREALRSRPTQWSNLAR